MCQDVNTLTEKRDLECACLLDFVLYRQGSLLDTESWLFRPCGRGPTLAF